MIAQARRAEALVKDQLVSREEYDSKRAAAEALEATVRADSAAVASVRLNLGFASIRSPIDGRAGNLMVHLGNLVKANETGSPLVVINQMRPVLVRFTVPQGDLPEILREKSRSLTVVASPDTGSGSDVSGTLTFVDNAVDAATGTVLLKAEFPNRDGSLWPGQFLRVRLRLDVQKDACVIPAPAVSSGQMGTFVFVLNPDTTVSQRPVRVTRNYAELAVIAEGLQPGETVVTDGQLRLSPGARVSIRPAPGRRAETPK